MPTFKTRNEKTLHTLRNLLVGAFEGGSNYWYEGLDIARLPTGFKKEDLKEGGKAQPDDPYNPGKKDYYHWAELVPSLPGGAVKFFDRESEEDGKMVEYVLDLKKLHRGWKLLRESEEYMRVYHRILEGQDDAGDADIFLQLCVFGEVIYG